MPNDHDRICLELASALCARLCHDLSQPPRHARGTLELALEEPEQAAEALSIAGEAAASMVARLQLLRAAWAGDCGPMGRAGLAELAAGLPPRVRPSWTGWPTARFDGRVARILLNLLLLGADALPFGGHVALAGRPDPGIVLTVSGPSVRWNAELAACLLDPARGHGSTPRTVQMPLTARLATAAGLRSVVPAGALRGPGPQSAPRCCSPRLTLSSVFALPHSIRRIRRRVDGRPAEPNSWPRRRRA